MGALQRFEQKLESMISGAFARAFRSAVEPVEISAALQREVDNNSQILSRDRRLVPNDFRVELSRADYDRLADGGVAMINDLAEQLDEHARSQGYVFPGDIAIEFDHADDLTTGRFRIASSSRASVTGPTIHQTPPPPAAYTPTVSPTNNVGGYDIPTARPQAPATPSVTLEVNGSVHPLIAPGIVVGRGSDSDLRITDPGVSRKHAEFAVTATAEGPLVTVTDLGSTNGMTVNGHAMTRAALRDGTVVRIGNTDIVVRIHSTDRG